MEQQTRFPLVAMAVVASLLLSFSLLIAETLQEPEIVVSQTSLYEGQCASANLEDSFPDLIVEKILVEAGISASDVPRINKQLDEAAEKHLDKLMADEEQVDGPLAMELALEEANHARFTVYASVMDEYMSDAMIMTDTFSKISEQRQELIESCLKESEADSE